MAWLISGNRLIVFLPVMGDIMGGIIGVIMGTIIIVR